MRCRKRGRGGTGRTGREKSAAPAVVKAVGCNGMCHCEPIVQVVESGTLVALYGNVTPLAAREIARRHTRGHGLVNIAQRLHRAVGGGEPVDLIDHLLDNAAGPAAEYLGKQRRIVLENCGEIDPGQIDEYVAREGYQGLTACLRLDPEAVIAGITESGLRGRGGAGFSDRAEVGDGAKSGQRSEVRHLQRRRRRSRSIHGPAGAGGGSAPRAGGAGDCCLRDWRS